jgi:hypothetical protein
MIVADAKALAVFDAAAWQYVDRRAVKASTSMESSYTTRPCGSRSSWREDASPRASG